MTPLDPVVATDAPRDPDSDGTYGYGETNVVDVQALFANGDDEAVRRHPEAFEFNDGERVNVVDVQRPLALFGQ